MKTVNKVFKWSCLISGFTAVSVVGVIFFSWFTIEMASMLMGVSA